MTEHEWFTTTDPRLMLAHLQQVNIGFESVFPTLTGSAASQCDTIRCVRGSPFTKKIELVRYVPVSGGFHLIKKDNRAISIGERDKIRAIDADILKWRDGTIPKIAQAIHDGEPCSVCSGDGLIVRNNGESFECDHCGATGLIKRYNPIQMAMLADALEEAGCEEQAILDHLRGTEACAWCKGSGDEPGNKYASGWQECGHCNGTGKRPNQRHEIGCHAIAMFLGA